MAIEIWLGPWGFIQKEKGSQEQRCRGKKLWSVPLPGTQASCMEEVGATARKSNGTKMWSTFSANLGVCTQWAARKVFHWQDWNRGMGVDCGENFSFLFCFFLSEVEPFQGLEQRSGMNWFTSGRISLAAALRIYCRRMQAVSESQGGGHCNNPAGNAGGI